VGNYAPTDLSGRYDGFLFVDETEAINPLDADAGGGAVPETYSWGC